MNICDANELSYLWFSSGSVFYDPRLPQTRLKVQGMGRFIIYRM